MVHAGVYRERVVPARGGEKDKPIIYLSAQWGQAVVKGSDVFAPKWERGEGSEPIFRGSLDPAMFQGENPFHRGISINGSDTSKHVRPAQGELEEVLGEVVVQGQPYTQVVRLANLRKQERSWLVPEDGKSILVHFPKATEPSRCLVEITTRIRTARAADLQAGNPENIELVLNLFQPPEHIEVISRYLAAKAAADAEGQEPMPAEVVAQDDVRDIALLRVTASCGKQFRPVAFGPEQKTRNNGCMPSGRLSRNATRQSACRLA